MRIGGSIGRMVGVAALAFGVGCGSIEAVPIDGSGGTGGVPTTPVTTTTCPPDAAGPASKGKGKGKDETKTDRADDGDQGPDGCRANGR